MVKDFLVSLGAPVEVKTERFGVTKWDSVIAEMEIREVVEHVIGGEEVLRD